MGSTNQADPRSKLFLLQNFMNIDGTMLFLFFYPLGFLQGLRSKIIKQAITKVVIQKLHREVSPVEQYTIDLVNIYALSICTRFFKNQVGKIQFNELDFRSISNWIFTACVACKNQFQNLFLQFVKLDFSDLNFQQTSCTDGQGDSLF